jgi:protein TonB
MEFHRIQNAIDLLGPPKPVRSPEHAVVPPATSQSTDDLKAGTAPAPVATATPSTNGDAKSGTAQTPLAPATAPSTVAEVATLDQGRPRAPVALSTLANTPIRHVPGDIGPKLGIAWGDFHHGVMSSIAALLRRPFGRGPGGEDGQPIACPYLRDTRVEGRVPLRAVMAAGLWHIAILALPISLFTGLPHRNPALQNVELRWSGPIDDLPLLEIPREQPRVSPRVEPPKPLRPLGADAFHPRQRIFTDPVRPTHPRQTLINPAAPALAPKLLPNLPNMVQFQQVAGPAKPRMQITEEMLKKLRPREKRTASDTSAPVQNAPNMEQQVTDLNLPAAQDGPARPKLEWKAGAAPRVAQRTQSGDAGPAPDVGATQVSAANGSAQALVAISAHPAPPAPVVQAPQGNLAARVSISPEGKKPSEPGGDSGAPGAGSSTAAASGAGQSFVGVSISGGNPTPSPSAGNGAARMSAPAPRVRITRPDPKPSEDLEERTSPPDFAALPPGAQPEVIFASRKVYTLNVNMPNLNSSTGSWILKFSEFRTSNWPRMASTDLSGPVPLKKVDPKYPQTLMAERVEGEVVLYAVIRRDGSVDSIQLVRGIDQQLDANAMKALAQWQFRPASRQGTPIELEAIVHIPFRLPEYQ